MSEPQAQTVEQAVIASERKAEELEHKLSKQYNLSDPVERREYHNHVWDITLRTQGVQNFLKHYASRLGDSLEMTASYDIVYYDSSLFVSLTLTRKYMEISESCSHTQSQEEFDKCFEEMLEEVDSECVADIDFNLKVRNELEVRSWKISCDGDYCRCGNEFEITIRGESPSKTISLLRLYLPRVVEIIENVMTM